MKYLSRDISLKLDVNRCVGCGMCAIVCPHGVFDAAGRPARIAERDACMECGACARNCPANAIAVTRGVGCAEAIISGMITGKQTCCGEGGCCCASTSSPPGVSAGSRIPERKECGA